MKAVLTTIWYYASHPDALIYVTATALLYPVLFAEVLALLYAMVELGRFTVEMAGRAFDGRRSLARLEDAADTAREAIAEERPTDAVDELAAASRGWVKRRFAAALADGSDLSRTRLVKILADLELAMTKRLERTRLFVRFGPVLGLMGTLIPISPALIALAKGDITALSTNLMVAFSATVVGLLIGALAFFMSAVRDRVYAQDISDIEYTLDLLGVAE